MSKDPVIPKEEAQKQLDALVELYDYEVPDEGSEIPRLDTPLLRHIMAGRVEIVDSGDGPEVVQHLRFPVSNNKSLKWENVDGVAWTSSLKGDDVQADYRFAARCCAKDVKVVLAMRAVDHKTMKDLVRFFAAAVA